MNNLIQLEWKRNNLKVYHIAVFVTMSVMLGFLYLSAAIPHFEDTETDLEIFLAYSSLVKLNNIVSMAIFSILSAVMASKFIIEEYAGKKSILLFSYPISRKKILNAKIIMVFAYIVISKIMSGVIELLIFFTTESLFPLCQDRISVLVIFNSVLSFVCYSFISGLLGVISLWFGLWRKSITTTIVTSCILASFICQIMAVSFSFNFITIIIFVIVFILALLVWKNLQFQVQKMEV